MQIALIDSSGPEPVPLNTTGPLIGIIGSGDYSRSLALRLVLSGYRVMVGSRCPDRVVSSLFPDGVEICSQAEMAAAVDGMVFVAVYPEYYPTLTGLREQLAGKVLIDVSNAAQLRAEGQSNAERLAEIFPRSKVVKAFNVVSAWALQAGAQDGSRQVLVCSDHQDSKSSVLQLARQLGFIPVDQGGLRASKQIEEAPLILFPSWGGPILTTFLIFLFFYFYIFLRSVLLPYLDHGANTFSQLPLIIVNQTLPVVALVTLALVYLPGLLAAVLQLYRETKYQRFPGWLDRWLCSRKQLGLLSFLAALLHAIYSMCLTLRKAAHYNLLNEAYQQVHAGLEDSRVESQVWRSDLYLTCGILGFGVLALLAITSLPSVGNTLNWREFTFVQSGLGYAALTLSTMHTLFFGWNFAFLPRSYPYHMPPVFLLALILPCVVLTGRFLLALPCFSLKLTMIRRGWESPSKLCEAEAAQNFDNV
ncbi:metalloreductase STEAP3 [Salarias fasciatus]|uniref:Metalloreductase STEAP3-like n=1 Tax=Salarias fasciatus TaxID=181472 RepID=A0A672IGV6_SALFA|nr:metalloreductase STEAP3-like [Salarias fasciatus]